MDYLGNDELKIYRGQDFVISKYIVIHQPTLGEIADYGEKDYYSMVYTLTATPSSMKGQLWKMWKMDYTTITAYQMFLAYLPILISRMDTSIIFGNLDFNEFEVEQNDDGEPYLIQEIDGEKIILDEYTYILITDYLRAVHFIEKDEKRPANETTKMILIEDAVMDLEKKDDKTKGSYLKNLISAMINSEGFKYDHTTVWNMKINAFMDSVKRVGRIKDANMLMQSAYSGFGINIKDIKDKERLDWLGDLK